MEALASEFPAVAAATKCAGMRGKCETPHGLVRDQAISAIQKYARRGELDKGMRCLFDLLFLAMDRAAPRGAVKAVLTNVANRIVVASAEDCLHPGIYPRLRDHFRYWGKEENRLGARGLATIAAMYATVVLARKRRITSVVKLYAAPEKMSPDWQATWSGTLEVPYDPVHGGDSPAQQFQRLLEAGDLRAAGLLEALREVDDKYGPAWRAMREVLRPLGADAMRVYDALRDLHADLLGRQHREAFLFVYQAVVLTVFRANVASWRDAPEVPAEYGGISGIMPTLRAHLSDPAPIQLDDYCVDMHTARGRAAGRDILDFALTGAAVVNPDEAIVPPRDAAIFEQMYVDSKRQQAQAHEHAPAAKKPKQQAPAFLLPPLRAADCPVEPLPPLDSFVPLQLRTCGSKPMTYRVTLEEGQGQVAVKPTLRTDPVVVDSCKAVFGLRPLGARIVALPCKFVRDAADATHRIVATPAGTVSTFLVTPLVTRADGTTPAPMLADLVRKKDAPPAQRAVPFGDAASVRELCKIAMYRWLFGASDLCPRNVLIDDTGHLYSIDENRMGVSDKVFPYWHQVSRFLQAQPTALREACEELEAVAAAQDAPPLRQRLVDAVRAAAGEGATVCIDGLVLPRLAGLREHVAVEVAAHGVVL